MSCGAVQSIFLSHPSFPFYPRRSRVWKQSSEGPRLSPLGVQHLDEEVVVGHVPVQVLVVQVLLRLQADGPDLWQAQKQLPELLRLLRVVAQGVVQQGRVHLLLDTFHQLEVLEVFDIWIEKEKKKRWPMSMALHPVCYSGACICGGILLLKGSVFSGC